MEFKMPEESVSAQEKNISNIEKLQGEVTKLGLNIDIMEQLTANDIDALEDAQPGFAIKAIRARQEALNASSKINATGEVKNATEETFDFSGGRNITTADAKVIAKGNK